MYYIYIYHLYLRFEFPKILISVLKNVNIEKTEEMLNNNQVDENIQKHAK